MAAWAAANKGLATAAAERERIRGTAQTDNPLMKDFKSRMPLTPSVQSADVSKLGKGHQRLVDNPNAAKAAPPKPAPSTSKTSPSTTTSTTTKSKPRSGFFEEYDAYDVVLEYLFSEGHVDSVEEAHYVMMEMDTETIGSICEAASDQSDKQIEKGVKTTYKAGNVIDNQHQGRSRGLDRLPSGERTAKTKRMRGRLKARRDDLFGERNRREDAAREEIRKKYGL